MSRSRLPALLPPLAVLLVLGAAPAHAQAVDVLDELQQDGVAVEAGVQTPIDEAAVEDAVESSSVPTYVAVVTAQTVADAGGAAALVQSIGESLGDSSAAVLVVADRATGTPEFRAAEGDAAFEDGVDAGAAIDRALAEGGGGEVTEQAVTAVVTDFVDEVQVRDSASGGSTSSSGGGGSGGLLALLGLGALGFGGYAVLKGRRTARSRATELDDLRADVESLYGRLGSDVQLLAPGDDAVARQALADASERYTATGALLAKADSPGEYAAARRTAVEGIAAARVVRQRLGLDPGPDVPMPEGQGPKLTERSRVQVGDDEYDGSPRYEPGRPHYYEGGYYGGQAVPGGWYATPFWQTLLMGSMMSGGLGGGYGRRGYGRGYAGGSGGFGGGVFGGGLGGGLGGGGLGGRRRGGGGGWSGAARRGGGGSWGGGGGGRRRGGGGGW